MKQLFGIPHNVEQTIIGRITKTNRFYIKRSDFVFVSDQIISTKGYAAFLTPQKVSKNLVMPTLTSVSNIDILEEGDIVSISNEGIINVVFEKKSSHNSIFITARCNSNCIMCPQPPEITEAERHNLIIQHISLLPKSTRSIGVTGGEPTLSGDRLIEIIGLIKKRLPNTHINLLTNGILLDDISYVKKISRIANGKLTVDVPINSDIDTIHNEITRTKTFYKTINGIYNLAKFRIKVGIRVVISKMNYKRLPDLAEFIYSNFPFVYQIAFMQMEPIGNALDNIKDLWIDPADYNKELERAVFILHNRDLNVLIYNSQLCVLPDSLKRFAVQSISEWKNIYSDECEKCSKKMICPGFFLSSKNYFSKSVKAI